MYFKSPYFCFSASSLTSHKHELLCATRWLENRYIPSGIFLFLWIIPVLFTLNSSLFWWINYWHFWCSILLLICSSFSHLPQLTTQFHYHICLLSLNFILQLISISEIHYQSIFWHYSYCCSYPQSGTLFSRHFLLHLPQSLPI